MQAAKPKIYIKPFSLSQDMGIIAVNKEVCDVHDISFQKFLNMEFHLVIQDRKLILEGCIPTREQQPSSDSTPSNGESKQGADISG